MNNAYAVHHQLHRSLQDSGATGIYLSFASPLLLIGLLSLSSCHHPDLSEKRQDNCSDVQAVKCSILNRVTSPSHDYEAVTKIDSYGGGFGTGYDSADVYINRVGARNADTLLLSIEDNADDVSGKNLIVNWPSPDQIVIRYGHGNVTFQVTKFAAKTITTVHDATLDQVVR